MTTWLLLSLPADSTPEHVQPSVIQNITPDAGWLTQPVATLLTGFLAVVAASIAFGGVYYAQRVSRATTKAQLRHQRAALIRQERQHNQTLSAEFNRQARAERLAALSEALAALSALHEATLAFGMLRRLKPEQSFQEQKERFAKAVNACGVPVGKLRLLGMQDAANAFAATAMEFGAQLERDSNSTEFSSAVGDKYVEAQKAFWREYPNQGSV